MTAEFPNLTFIGLSGIGKSYWTKRLAKSLQLDRICIDDEIGKRLKSTLNKSDPNIRDLASWLGFPFEDRYKVNSKIYLEIEEETTKQALNLIKSTQNKFILDTTGSFIYLSDQLCSEVKKHTKIIYLELPEADFTPMFEQFIEHPKPVIWGDKFKFSEDADKLELLKKQYPDLIKWRAKKYSKLADLKISIPINERKTLTTTQLKNYLINTLSKLKK